MEASEITRAEREAGTSGAFWECLTGGQPEGAITGEWLLPVVDNDSL